MLEKEELSKLELEELLWQSYSRSIPYKFSPILHNFFSNMTGQEHQELLDRWDAAIDRKEIEPPSHKIRI